MNTVQVDMPFRASVRVHAVEVVWLAGTILLGGALRTYIWFHGYAQYGVHGLVRHGDGYLEMAAALAGRNREALFGHWRSYQFVYPIYLAPMYALNLRDSIYVFWLHHTLAAATICLIYLATKRLFGIPAAMIASLAYAVHLQVAYWFNWTLSDNAFHFQLALTLWSFAAYWNARSTPRFLMLLLSVGLLCFTRPEGFVVTIGFVISLVFGWSWRRVGAAPTAAAAAVLALVAGGTLVVAFSTSKPFREKAFSNVDFAWGLYYGSQRTPTRADLVDRMLLEMRSYGDARAAVDPEHRSPWYWNSVAGVERIRAHPIRYVRYWSERVVNAIAPSWFRQGVSLRYKIFDRSMTLFLVLGTLVALGATRHDRTIVPNIVFAAFCIYAAIGFVQSEWDVRVQLSPQLLLMPVASFGWTILWWHVRRHVGGSADATICLPGVSSEVQ